MRQNSTKSALTHFLKMCGKCSENLVNSAARVRRIFAKCAANVRRVFLNYVGIFVLESYSNITTWGKFKMNNNFYNND